MGYDPRGPSVCELPNGEQRKINIFGLSTNPMTC